jgi:hypothetical protein
MLKITDSQYHLPKIIALDGMELMESGTTQPMMIRGVDMETGERGQYIVKFYNSSRMSMKSSCRELIGAWVARELDIHVVEPVIVNIDQDFVNTITGKPGYQSALKSIGLNFGSIYESGYMEIVKGNFKLGNFLLEQAKMIFMFDMLIANADRGKGKPNVLTNSEKLLVYDHELAFSFIGLLSILRNQTPWIMGPAEEEMYKSHFFYSYLRGTLISFSEQIEKLSLLNDDFWGKVYKFVPEEWRTDEITEIRTHIEKIIANKDVFSKELTKILLS